MKLKILYLCFCKIAVKGFLSCKTVAKQPGTLRMTCCVNVQSSLPSLPRGGFLVSEFLDVARHADHLPRAQRYLQAEGPGEVFVHFCS
mmetsp:Transcript_32769/g.60203  ORF Transcript_32769/g.60203 Transcript_32769/m.60203 type:complete len:88 (-) Transcript_32769:213-476(-)